MQSDAGATILIALGIIVGLLGMLFLAIAVALAVTPAKQRPSDPTVEPARALAGGLVCTVLPAVLLFGAAYACIASGERTARAARHYNAMVWPGLTDRWQSSLIGLRCGEVWRP